MDIVNGRTTPIRSTAAVLSMAALALCAGAAFARPAIPKAPLTYDHSREE